MLSKSQCFAPPKWATLQFTLSESACYALTTHFFMLSFPISLPRISSDDRIEIIQRIGRAQHLIAQEKSSEAAKIYRAVLKTDPKIANLHLSFSMVLLQIREREAAETELRTEIQPYPQSVEARLHLCALLQERAGDSGGRMHKSLILKMMGRPTHLFHPQYIGDFSRCDVVPSRSGSLF
jgi:hypothetical protein